MREFPTEAARELLLAFADDEHLMGQQHTEWIGVAPFLEEDLAFSSIGQDELGHSVSLYEIVCELDGVEPSDAAIDALAYDRDAAAYRSCALTEMVTTDWATALVRHWIYDTVEQLRWNLVSSSSIVALGEAAERASREETYHRMHANALIDSLLGSPNARAKILAALESISGLIAGLLGPTLGEDDAVDHRVLSSPLSTLREHVEAAVQERFGVSWSMDSPADHPRGPQRSDSFGPLMTRMREVIDYDPEATW